MKKQAIIANVDGSVIRKTEAATADLALVCAIIVVDPFVLSHYARRDR